MVPVATETGLAPPVGVRPTSSPAGVDSTGVDTDARYGVEIFDSVASIAEADWDALLRPGDLLHSHRFLRAVEAAEIEGSRLWFLTVRWDGELMATAAISAFDLDLALFLDTGVQRAIAAVRRGWRGFLRTRVLLCGVPVSLGQKNLVIADPRHESAVLARLVEAMESIAAEQGIRHLCVKELEADDARRWAGLEAHGFFRGHSIPTMTLDLPWPSFETYLASLRHGYRRKIRKSLRKLGRTMPSATVVEGPDLPREAGVYRVGRSHVSPAEFHRLYLGVMSRAETKLEVLNVAFFEALDEALAEKLELLAVVDDGAVHAVALLARDGDTLFFLLVGQAQAQNAALDPYFNLLYAILDRAFELGCRRVKLGQTAYWSKQQIGAQAEDLFLYFKCTRRFQHAMLRRFGHQLFPPMTLKNVHVFKEVAS